MQWQEVCENKYLQDIPFKIELNKWGQIVMSPAKKKHSVYQGEIEYLLRVHKKAGKVFPECPIQTSDNVKVADVVWMSLERYQQTEAEDVLSIAPEICIEIKSASNTQAEMRQKKDLYLEARAEEVWFCNEQGIMSFYNQQGQLSKSILVPDFPHQVEI
jgi:Uma2 family endonuclease